MDERVMYVYVGGVRREVVAILEDTQRYVIREGWRDVSYPMSECRKAS